jgi:hypothetical protein
MVEQKPKRHMVIGGELFLLSFDRDMASNMGSQSGRSKVMEGEEHWAYLDSRQFFGVPRK